MGEPTERNSGARKRSKAMTKRCRAAGGRSAGLLLAVLALLLSCAQVASTDFELDGSTTYCWQVDTSIYANTIGAAVDVQGASGDGCPLELAIDFSATDVYPYETVNITWSASVREDSDGDMLSNDLNVSALALGLDRLSGDYYEVTHSALHACADGLDCSPVRTEVRLEDNTTTQVANFSSTGTAAFSSSELTFSSAGNYTLLAHLILPTDNYTSTRYDYAVFTTLEVLSTASADSAGSSEPYSESTSGSESSGVSTEVICVLIITGIVVVALVAIGFTTLRAKADRPAEAVAAANDGDSKYNAKRGRFGFSDTNSGMVGLGTSDGLEENEFAMLSVHEATMRRGNTFLGALGRGRQSLKKGKEGGSPIPFAGPVCRPSFKVKGAHLDLDAQGAVDGDVTPSAIIMDTPATGRGSYLEEDTPKPNARAAKAKARPSTAQPAGQIMFNDIHEDEVDSSVSNAGLGYGPVADTGVRRRNNSGASVVDLNLTDVSVRIKQHHATAQQEAAWRPQQEEALTADDLRLDQTQGPLDINDLGPSHNRHRRR